MIAAVIVPGRGYPAQAPLLSLAVEALTDHDAATGKTVVTIEDGDHGLRVPGRLRAYTEVLGTAGTAIEDFLADLP